MGTCVSCQSTCRDKDTPEKADDEFRCIITDNAPKYHLKEEITCENRPIEATCVSLANDPGNFAELTKNQHNTKCTSEDTDKAHCIPDPVCCSSTTCTDATPVVCIGQVADESSPPLRSEGAVAVVESHDSVGLESTLNSSQQSPQLSTEKLSDDTCRPQTPGTSKGERFSAKFRRSVSQLTPTANRTMKLKSALSKRWNNDTSAPRMQSKPSSNTNTPGEYIWLQEVLWNVVKNEARSLGVVDTGTGKSFTPVFFVLGSCPNTFCSMQAVMYSVSVEQKEDLDFWWVKPQKSKVAELERNTLNRNAKGPHKNDPGRSKPFYKAFADLFVQNSAGPPGMRFGIEMISNKAHKSTARAYLKHDADDTKVYLHMVWQEDWTSNPLARKQYIKGKIVYQKDLEVLEFFSRQYAIQNGSVSISDVEGPAFKTILPNNDIKELWEVNS